MIEDRNLKAGMVLVADYPARGPKRKEYRCDVVAGEGGKLVYLIGAKEYSSPSAAGSAVMGGVACNGWRFWTVAGTEKPKATKPAPKAKAATKASKPATKAKKAPKTAKRGANAPEKIAGGSNGHEAEPPAEDDAPPAPTEKPVNCGDCGQEFPTSREAGDHMRDAHGSAEAAGTGGG